MVDSSPTKAAMQVARIIGFIVNRLEKQEGLQVSGPVAGQSKSVAVGSSPRVAHMLARVSTTRKLVVKRASKNLGAMAAGGRRRSVQLQKERHRRGLLTVQRMKRISRTYWVADRFIYYYAELSAVYFSRVIITVEGYQKS